MLKKILPVLLVLFLGFWLVTDPHGLARATRSSADGTSSLFTSLITFLRAL
jgi:hypothetical protein